MIDYETQLFDEVARTVLRDHPDAYVCSQHVISPPAFPAVELVEALNNTFSRSIDSSLEEKYASVTYTADVFSAALEDPKAECRSIMGAISDAMRRRNFKRVMCQPVDNAADPSIYRMTARFTGVVAKDGTYYGR